MSLTPKELPPRLDGESSLDQAILALTETILQLETPKREKYSSLIKDQLHLKKENASADSEFHLRRQCTQTQRSVRLYAWPPSTITLAMQLGL